MGTHGEPPPGGVPNPPPATAHGERGRGTAAARRGGRAQHLNGCRWASSCKSRAGLAPGTWKRGQDQSPPRTGCERLARHLRHRSNGSVWTCETLACSHLKSAQNATRIATHEECELYSVPLSH